MSLLRSPLLWFPLALIALIACGGWLLSAADCTQSTARDLRFYWFRHYWQCAFDAASVACGAGLLTYDLDEAYTPAGRWLLTAIGAVGAFLFVGAAAQGWRRLARSNGWPLPLHPFAVLAMFAATQFVAIAVVWTVEAGGGGASNALGGSAGAVWRAVAAGCGFGAITSRPLENAAWVYALAGLAPGLVCAVAMLTSGGIGRIGVRGFYVSWRFVTYSLFLVAAAAGLTLLEAPRRSTQQDATVTAAAGQPSPPVDRGFLYVLSACGPGFAAAPLGDRAVSEGSKALLAGCVLVGGIVAAPGGGVSWSFFLMGLKAAGFLLRGRRIGALEAGWVRTALSAALLTLLAGLLVLGVALGLLAIENSVSSRFQAPSTLADALLDAASAVGGASLTSGVTANVTSKNLNRGIGLPIDAYQYGMTLLMLAMFVGRLLPLLALSWAAGSAAPSPADRS